jgi:pilus assembly protein CpaB
MKRNHISLLGIAFVVAVATTGIFYKLFVEKLGAVSRVPIVVTTRNLSPGSLLTAESLKITTWTGSSTPGGAFTAVEQAVGRTTALPLEEGSPVTVDKLAAAGAVEAAVPLNSRAVSTHVTDSVGVLEMLRAGDHVDVQTLNGKDKETEIRTILEDRKVLAIHTSPEATSNTAAAAPVVTLLVDQTEADALALADSSGRVRLALRNPKDSLKSARPPMSLNALMHGAIVPAQAPGAVVPANLAQPLHPAGTFAPIKRVN